MLPDPHRPISAAERSGAGDHRQCGARRLRPALLGARRLRADHLRRDRRPIPTQSRFYEPFAGSRPATIAEADWAALQARARTIITDVDQPGLSEASRFLHARLSAALRARRQHLGPAGRRRILCASRSARTRPPTSRPQQIHDIGLREVARIRAEMDRVAREAGFPSREAFIQELRTNPRYYPTTRRAADRRHRRAFNKRGRRLAAAPVRHAAAAHLHDPRNPGRDRRGDDHRLLQPGLAARAASPAPIMSTRRG